MIYTVTLNPAVDYVLHADHFKTGAVNRSSGEEIYFGGKGLNVSQVLLALGIPSRALGFVAGFTGEAIERGISLMGIETDFVHVKNGFSRINTKIRSDTETDINGIGPEIPDEAVTELFGKLDRVTGGDTVVLAGSVPKTIPSDIYEKILERLSGRDVRAVVDAAGELLKNVLKYRPFLIKPNDIELGELFGVSIDTAESAADYARELQRMGARNVLVSMAERGSVLLDENGEVHSCGVCRGTVVNSVGAGDSMVAGFIAGCDKGYDYALRLGTACGGATAFSGGLCGKEDIERLFGSL